MVKVEPQMGVRHVNRKEGLLLYDNNGYNLYRKLEDTPHVAAGRAYINSLIAIVMLLD
jgi:hypothetical protein